MAIPIGKVVGFALAAANTKAGQEIVKAGIQCIQKIPKSTKEIGEGVGEASEAAKLPKEIGEGVGEASEAAKLPKEIGEGVGEASEAAKLPKEIGEGVGEASEAAKLSEEIRGVKETDALEKKGGSYKEVFKEGEGDKYEVHHIPADSISKLERGDGPAIKMEKGDHRQTASYGASKEAMEYRAQQKELIDQGKFREAVQMDIDDIREKFGDKYDDAINEMQEYVNKLKTEGKIDG